MSKNLAELISQMTLEEKAGLCTGASAWTTTPIERLEIPELICSDGPHGVRRQPNVHDMGAKSLPATCFPTASCVSASWDVDLIHEMGQALAEECIALDVDMLLGPGTNMKRSPLGGRNFEYFSEDPYMAGEMAASFINGVQSLGVGTSLKHYAANNQEFQRFSISAEVDERTLRELYLPAFETAVKKSQPWSVMCSYNKVNGTFASEHKVLLTDILKKEWGFEGLVVSDWGAVRNRVKALQAGLDWEMPGPQDRRVQAVIEAVRAGTLDESVLNESVRRILRIVFKAQETPKTGKFDIDGHHALAQKIASEGMVLLKNDGILPLKAPQHVAIIGKAAEQAHFQGGGSSHINPTKVAVPFSELQSRGGNAEFSYAEGYPADNSFQPMMIDQAVGIARSADVAVLFIALPTYKESEGYDRKDLDLTDQQIALIKAVSAAQPKCVVVLNNGSPVVMKEWIDSVPAVLEAYMMGQAGGAAVADVLYGKVNPSGKLTETFPLRLEDTPSFTNWPGETGSVHYGEGMFIGYRHYDKRKIPVQFPFGFGLSYTTFDYADITVSAKNFRDTDGLTVTARITNTGKVAGKEVVQLYVRDHEASLVRPEKELKGFAKVSLNPGESKIVRFKLDFRSFAFYHVEHKQWITEDGEFEILIAASATDIRLSETVTLKSSLVLPCILDIESTIKEWLSDPRGKMVINPIYQQIENHSRAMFSQQDRYGDNKPDTTDNLGMGDVMEMMNDMPLVSVLMWQQGTLTMPAEDMVEGLLMQARNLGK